MMEGVLVSCPGSRGRGRGGGTRDGGEGGGGDVV